MSAVEDLMDFIMQNTYSHDTPYFLDRTSPDGGEEIPHANYRTVVRGMIQEALNEYASKPW